MANYCVVTNAPVRRSTGADMEAVYRLFDAYGDASAYVNPYQRVLVHGTPPTGAVILGTYNERPLILGLAAESPAIARELIDGVQARYGPGPLVAALDAGSERHSMDEELFRENGFAHSGHDAAGRELWIRNNGR